jgi:hypothetical protein
VLAEVLGTVGLCTLDMLLAHGPFDEVSAVFVAASIVLGLEHLHWSHVVFRCACWSGGGERGKD